VNIALSLRPSEPDARFARQLGLRHVVSSLPASSSGVLELADLVRTRAFFSEAGLSWDVIENLPTEHYFKAMFGLPGRDEQIDKVRTTIRNMGQAGIGVLQYQWMLLGGLRTEYSPTGRGGSRVARFDWDVARRMPMACQVWRGPNGMIHLPDRELSSADVWSNLLYFLQALSPVAEEAGVKLAVHPDDPPIPTFMGVARIMTSLDAFQHLIDSVPSPNIGLGFCQGTISAIPGVDIPQAIRHFGRQGRIFFAHFRNSIGALPKFDEVFPDEGDTDLYDAAQAYREVGFDGLIRIDHSPSVAGDNQTNDRGFAFQVGYAKALDHALDQLGASTVAKVPVRPWRSAPRGAPLQLALTANCFDDIQLMMAQQMGVDEIVAEPQSWDLATLASMHNRVDKAGLSLVGVDTLQPELYDKAVQGLSGRDEQIDAVCEAIRCAGAAGVRLISYAWTPPGPQRTSLVVGRGGALVAAYDQEDIANNQGVTSPTEKQLWDNLAHFLGRVLPVAEAAGVRLACRPDDPPVSSQAGVPRILHTAAALVRLAQMVSSPSHGLDLCHRSLALMPGADVVALITTLGTQGRLFMARLAFGSGHASRFTETFLDEDTSLVSVLRAYKGVGFAGPIRVDRPPRLEGDASWGHKGRALDLGYVRALMQLVERLGS